MTTAPLIVPPKLKFIHAGEERTLNKHAKVQLAVRNGTMSIPDALGEPWILRAKVGGPKERFFTLAGGYSKLIPIEADKLAEQKEILWIGDVAYMPNKHDRDAIRGAKDVLNGATDRPADFASFLADRDAKRGVTLGQLAIDWKESSYDDENGRPRKDATLARMANDIELALRWWSGIVATTAATRFNDFIIWRRTQAASFKRGPGSRAADIDLNALSCLCQWAVFAHKLDKNPFEGRPIYHDPEDVDHCSDFMPESDEIVHRILTWFFSDPQNHTRCIAGGWLAWLNLTGQRVAEPYYMHRHDAQVDQPHRPDLLPIGTLFPCQDKIFSATKAVRVHREKNGQNPFAPLHPAVAAFLQTWAAWLDQLPLDGPRPAVRHWFPHPADHAKALVPIRPQGKLMKVDTSLINELLRQACAELKLPHYTPSGFGRAYFTRVCKSQQFSNAVIAELLGQTTLGALIRSTYGRGNDQFGSLRYDWLPEVDGKPQDPAWKQLEPDRQSNVIAL